MIFVLSIDGDPLMPIQRPGRVRRMLKSGKARIAGYNPFTIQLTYTTTKHVQPVILGIDPGRTNIGLNMFC